MPPKRACLEIWLAQIGRKPKASATVEELEEETQNAFAETGAVPPLFGKTMLCDGRTGEPFDQPVTVGYIYMLKLIHLVEDKIHARSTGPTRSSPSSRWAARRSSAASASARLEVWALEAYGAAHILQELLTVKSDDVVGRVKTYEAIVKGEDVLEPGVPESFKVLVKELQSLGLSIDVFQTTRAVSPSPRRRPESCPSSASTFPDSNRRDLFNARSQ